MHRTHKIALDPTNVQATGLARAAGCARFAYNWALARWSEQYEAHRADPSLPRPSQMSLRRELNAIKRQEFPWMLESTKCAPQEAIIALGVAFKNFFAGRTKHPTFKKRGQHDAFRLSSGQFRIEDKRLRVPNVGWIRMREDLRWKDARAISVTISKRAGRWFASIQCEFEELAASRSTASGLQGTIGVDVGVREYVLSDGTRHQVPRHLRTKLRSLRRAQQSLSRKTKGSANRAKARARVARLHAGVVDARSDWLHKITTNLAVTHDKIVIEDLNVRGMASNHHLALSIIDASFGEFRRQLEYKTKDHGAELVLADRWFPSSKICSTCGARTKRIMSLSVRTWTCESCGAQHDRDLNAARNLAAYDPAGSSSVAACRALLAAADDESEGSSSTSRRDESGTEHRNELQLV